MTHFRMLECVHRQQHISVSAAPFPIQMQIKDKFALWVECRPSVQNTGTHNPTMEATEVLIQLLMMLTPPLMLGSCTADLICDLASCACAVIWDALKAAAASDLGTAAVILDSAGIVVSAEDMSVCYDERGQPLCICHGRGSIPTKAWLSSLASLRQCLFTIWRVTTLVPGHAVSNHCNAAAASDACQHGSLL